MWAPESTANSAIKYYKGHLRAALENLMASSKVVRNRTKSSQSDRLSLGSIEGHNIFTVTDYDQFPTSRLSHIMDDLKSGPNSGLK
jgi:hypothetical protein